MTRQFGRLMLILTVLGFVALPASADGGATVSGVVKDSAGKVQMGAAVEIIAVSISMPSPVKVFTDEKGHYSAAGLLPGVYFVKATANKFLPSLRENVSLRSGANTLVNLTLNTLIEAFQLVPTRRRNLADDDDWQWTLRSAANRPILRVLENDGPLVVVSQSEDDRVLKAKVAFIAGSNGEGFSSSDVRTNFTVEQSLFSSGTMSFNGSVSNNFGQPTGVLRASYKHELPNGSHPEIAFTAHRFASPETAMHRAALSAMSLSIADGFTLADFIDLNFGGEMQSIQYRGRVTAFRPFGSVTAHLSPNTLVEYRYATSRPSTRLAKGFDSAPADLTETNPRVGLLNNTLQLERAGHHEVGVSRRIGKSNLHAAYYSDRVKNAALTGVGDADIFFSQGDFLPDVYSNTFAYSGDDFQTRGFRIVAQRKISEALTATLNYSFGGALELGSPDELATFDAHATELPLFRTRKHHAVTSKLSGTVPGANTRWIASYKWNSGSRLVVPVDMFNASAGHADPYFNIFLRQPLPNGGFLPGKIEALVDVRNLLSQGYVPLLGGDGNTLYLVQSARAIRGGVAFNF